ncbi:hypothetical protein [Methylobacterium tarhaniae]|uniref:hypothetical protein n=1 Tax=Methylobacterium tarhaniae TaxID=1187852 RepID=UPI0012EE507A|nr:hypothetical protein [Methylobacterium tarhaniae]
MRAVLVIGIAAIAAAGQAEAGGGRDAPGLAKPDRVAVAPAADAPVTDAEARPEIRTSSAAQDAPEPMMTGSTTPAAPRGAVPGAAKPVPAAAKPWCTGRIFGTGVGFCALN